MEEFIRESKKFTGYGYFRMLFKENLIRKTIWFCKENRKQAHFHCGFSLRRAGIC